MSSSNSHGDGPRDGYIVSQDPIERRAVGERNVAHTSDPFGDSAAVRLAVRTEDRAADADAPRREGAVGSSRAGLGRELDVEPRRDEGGNVLGRIGHGERGEGLEGEGGAVGAGGDEGGGEGEDGAQAEGSIEGLGDGSAGSSRGGREEAQGRLVAGLNGDDGGGDGEDLHVDDEGGSSEVGRHANILEDGGGGEQRGRVSEGGREVVGAGMDGGDTGLGEGRLEGADVLGLGGCDLVEVVKLVLLEAYGGSIGELDEDLLVEGCLEVLECQGAVGWLWCKSWACRERQTGVTYNWRISRSPRPRATAASFWRLDRS